MKDSTKAVFDTLGCAVIAGLAFTMAACSPTESASNDTEPRTPALAPTAVLEGNMWNRDSKVYEIVRNGKTCVIAENYEDIKTDCFPAERSSASSATQTIKPLTTLDGNMWNRDSRAYIYTPSSAPNTECLIAENYEGIALDCSPK